MSLRSGARPKRRMMSDMNVVPYIDVMLVLVVILMVAAPFVNPSVVNLPSVSKASAAPADPVEVVVYAPRREGEKRAAYGGYAGFDRERACGSRGSRYPRRHFR